MRHPPISKTATSHATISDGLSLREWLLRAQSGYRSDVALLVRALERARVLGPLARPLQLPLGESIQAGELIALHNVTKTDGSRWLPLFSSTEILMAASTENAWSTAEGPLAYIEVRWTDLFQSMLLSVFSERLNEGVVFDLGSSSELQLTGEEVLSIGRGNALPLVGYAARQPTRSNEPVQVGKPATPPPAELVDTVDSVLKRERSVVSYQFRQIFMPERDVRPHLVLDIDSHAPEAERRRISRRVGDAIRRITLPPPGYIDVLFNMEDRMR